MLSNPDVQPNAAINRWIAAILLFNFKIVHVPADKHHGPDGLSRREPMPREEEDDNPEDWIDNALALGIWIVSWSDSVHADTSCAAAFNISLGEDDERTSPSRPRRDRRLPAKYHSGDYIASDVPICSIVDDHDPSPSIPLLSNNPKPTIDLALNADPESPPIATPTIENIELTPTFFLTSEQSDKADEEVERIISYLHSWRTPSDLTGNALTRFISKTQHFLLVSGKIWRRQTNGRHQLYVSPPSRLTLIRNAHDKLGHKGFYST
jgi:hypothetical protein